MKKQKAERAKPVPVRTGPTMRRLAKPTARKRARAYLVDGYCRPVAAISNYFGLWGNEMLALPRVTWGRRAFFGQARYIAEIGWDVWRDLEAAGLPPEFLDRFGAANRLIQQARLDPAVHRRPSHPGVARRLGAIAAGFVK